MVSTYLILALASVLHGITGMGFPLIGTPTLAAVMPLPAAIAMLALPTLLINALVLIGNPKPKRALTNNAASPASSRLASIMHTLRDYWLLAVMSVIGSVIGVKLLFLLPISAISLVMAVVILYYAAQGLLASTGLIQPLRVPTGRLSMAGFGLASGLIGGATNAMSPILLMYLLSKTEDKNTIAQASNLCYLLAKVVQIFMLKAQFVAFDRAQWQLLTMIAIISMLFLFLGMRLRSYISASVFRTAVYVILFALGIKIGYGALVTLSA